MTRAIKPRARRYRVWPPFWPDSDMEALCKNLGIDVAALSKGPPVPAAGPAVFGSMAPTRDVKTGALDPLLLNIVVWMRIGQELAKDRPEFNGGKRGRGRPGLKQLGEPGIDYERANFIWNLRHKLTAAGHSGSLSDAALIECAIKDGAELFKGSNKDVLVGSVSAGKGQMQKHLKEANSLRAKSLRRECELFRDRARWLGSVQPDVARMKQLLGAGLMPTNLLLSALSPEAQDLDSLMARLKNPFRRFP